MRTVLFLCSAVLLVEGALGGPLMQIKKDETRAAAIDGLKMLGELVNEKNFVTIGFDSLKQAGEAELGEPLGVFMVRLDELKAYSLGNDPRTLVKPLEQVLYPVTVKTAVKSSIVVSKVEGRWQATEFGSATLARVFVRHRAVSAESTKVDPSAFSVVRIPALNLQFLGYTMNDELMLVPLLDDPLYGFRAGVALPARRVFEAVKPEALRHNGLPR